MSSSQPFEAEVLSGLEPFAIEEIQTRLVTATKVHKSGSGSVGFEFAGTTDEMAALRTATAIYRVLSFDVPRPKALLGHQYFSTIIGVARHIISSQPEFHTLSLDAAGSDSTVMQRIKSELSDALGLDAAIDKGDLHIRIRPGAGSRGWQVLIRLTPRPLMTRSWRIHNFQGALNAATAAVMSSLTSPSQDDYVLNIGCGSASLMVERAALMESRMLAGIDNDLNVLGFAREHLHAAGVSGATLLCADATQLPYPSGLFNVLLADLPFGQLIGSHRENIKLYPAALAEAARVAATGARFAIITHEKRLLSDVLRAQSAWSVARQILINLNGLHPEITLLMLR